MSRIFRTIRSFPILFSLIAIALVVVVGGGLAFATAQQHQNTTSVCTASVRAGPRPAIGVPGIHPTRSLAASACASGAYVAGATYTAADVQAYLAANPSVFPLNWPRTKPLQIAVIQFVTKDQAETLMKGESLDGQVSPGGLVCYVKLVGPFSAASISPPPGIPSSNGVISGGHLIFDAQTGNLLVWGTDG